MHEVWLDANDDIWLVDPTEPDIFHGTLANNGWKHRKEFDVGPRKLIVKEQTNDKDAQYVYCAKSTNSDFRSKFYQKIGLAKAYKTRNTISNAGPNGQYNSHYVLQRAVLDWETVG